MRQDCIGCQVRPSRRSGTGPRSPRAVDGAAVGPAGGRAQERPAGSRNRAPWSRCSRAGGGERRHHVGFWAGVVSGGVNGAGREVDGDSIDSEVISTNSCGVAVLEMGETRAARAMLPILPGLAVMYWRVRRRPMSRAKPRSPRQRRERWMVLRVRALGPGLHLVGGQRRARRRKRLGNPAVSPSSPVQAECTAAGEIRYWVRPRDRWS